MRFRIFYFYILHHSFQYFSTVFKTLNVILSAFFFKLLNYYMSKLTSNTTFVFFYNYCTKFILTFNFLNFQSLGQKENRFSIKFLGSSFIYVCINIILAKFLKSIPPILRNCRQFPTFRRPINHCHSLKVSQEIGCTQTTDSRFSLSIKYRYRRHNSQFIFFLWHLPVY